jgi:hypothetical protein
MSAPLPLPLDPLPEETWHSYLTRRAAQHHCTLAVLADHLGLREPHGRWPAYYGITITDADARRSAHLLGLDSTQVHDMHLGRYDQLAFDLAGLGTTSGGIAQTRTTAHAAWIWLSGSTYCPACLVDSGGAWRQSWRLPWITTCLTHQRALVGTCPTCGAVPGLGNQFHTSAPSRLQAVPDGHACQHRASAGVCGANLTEAATTAATEGRLRRTQQMLALTNGARGTVAGISHTPLATLRAWQAAIGWATRHELVDTGSWGRTHRWSNPPRDPDLIDTLLRTVAPLLNAPTLDAAAEVLDCWCHQAGIKTPDTHTFTRATQPAAALQPIIDTMLARHGRAHIRLQRLTRADGQQLVHPGWDLDDIPQVVWPCALPSHLRGSTRPNQLLLRAVVAIMVARIRAAHPDWASAAADLSIPARHARSWTRYVCADRWDLKDHLITAATDLSRHLHQQPHPASWSTRGPVHGHGPSALRHAQQPGCRREDAANTWCPCSAYPAGPA